MITAKTTGIGSLPHHNVDAALEFSFRCGIPFLPQIPIRNPWEFMLPQALEGIPGLQAESDGTVTINLEIWKSRSAELDRRLAEAFARPAGDALAFREFEPSSAISSSWQPFVWELEELGLKLAKVQIAGPLTSQWSVKAGKSPAELTMQIYRLVLARSLAMTRRLQASGIAPILYLDEPGLYGLLPENPRHLLGLRELKLMVQTLRKEGVRVGLHCCSNTDWDAVLGLGIDILSIDVSLSLASLLAPERQDRVREFLSGGGALSLGVVPTARASLLKSLKAPELFSALHSTLEAGLHEGPGDSALVRRTLEQAIYTPACGLALHSVSDAELVMELLTELREFAVARLSSGAP